MTLPRITSILCLLFVLGCGGDDDSPADASMDVSMDSSRDAPIDTARDVPTIDTNPPDLAPPRPPNPPGDESFEFIVAAVGMTFDEDGSVAGLNLDGWVTDFDSHPFHGCRQRDNNAPERFGGEAGVDNQLATMEMVLRSVNPTLEFDADLMDGVRRGGLILLMRLENVGDWNNDGQVQLSLFVGADVVPELEMIDFRGQEMMAIAADQTFEVDLEASFPGGDPSRPALNIFRDAYIADGVLHTGSRPFAIRLGLSEGRSFRLDIQGSISGRPGPGRWETGVIGAASRVSDLVYSVQGFSMDENDDDEAALRALLPMFADIRSAGPEEPCDALSLGMELAVVPAVIALPEE